MTEQTEWPTRPPGRVAARFICINKKILDEAQVEVTLHPSTYGRDNVEWAPYTPAGVVRMVVNGPAGALFVEGGRYAVTFERAELSDLNLAVPTETVGTGEVRPGR